MTEGIHEIDQYRKAKGKPRTKTPAQEVAAMTPDELADLLMGTTTTDNA